MSPTNLVTEPRKEWTVTVKNPARYRWLIECTGRSLFGWWLQAFRWDFQPDDATFRFCLTWTKKELFLTTFDAATGAERRFRMYARISLRNRLRLFMFWYRMKWQRLWSKQ